jgi:hypothetical protein
VRWFQRRASAEKAANAPVQLASAAAIGAPSGTYFSEEGEPDSLPDVATDPGSVRRAWALGETLVTKAATATPSGERRAKAAL